MSNDNNKKPDLGSLSIAERQRRRDERRARREAKPRRVHQSDATAQPDGEE